MEKNMSEYYSDTEKELKIMVERKEQNKTLKLRKEVNSSIFNKPVEEVYDNARIM